MQQNIYLSWQNENAVKVKQKYKSQTI